MQPGTALVVLALLAPGARADEPFRFAVSGDSRDCGDVVMPGIAKAVLQSGAAFYWHLGDFRSLSKVDHDMSTTPLTKAQYLEAAWPDFIDHQLHAFGSLEVFLARGNHEVAGGESPYLEAFRPYLDSERLRKQRAEDAEASTDLRPYFHFTRHGVDFLTLDNASDHSFDETELRWIRTRLAADRASKALSTVVVGMHEALPGSRGYSHSMCDSPAGLAGGREVYDLLLDLQKAGKKVYVLSSHSHFVMEDVYRTPYWQGKVLPGWIVGTAGAVRYRLPEGVPSKGTVARTDVYGYLLGTVLPNGEVRFEFRELGLHALRLGSEAPEAIVKWCYAENSEPTPPPPGTCGTSR